MEMNQRIFKAREDARMTQQELADAVSKTRGAVAQWESGDVRPRHTTLVAIAKATNKPLLWLESGIGDDAPGLKVIGEVAAGTWKEGNVSYQPYGVPVAPDPHFDQSCQRLYRVVGTSMNKMVADGEYLHTVGTACAGLVAEHGDIVVVRRTEHELTEYTAKRFVLEGGERVLRPESHDPQWQGDIIMNGDESTCIEITDIVIAKWSPLGRGRRG